MRDSSFVLPANVLQVKRVLGGDGHQRIVICTAPNVGWPDEKSVKGLRGSLAIRVRGLKLSCITLSMKSCKQFNVWLVIDLGTSCTERRARWYRFAVQDVVNDKRYFATAKHTSPHHGKPQAYVNRRAAMVAAV